MDLEWTDGAIVRATGIETTGSPVWQVESRGKRSSYAFGV